MTPVLSGVRVVEQGTFITGPACGMLLGDLGADVVKVEQPGTGDPFRSFKGGLYSPHYQTYNRNKRSITLDPKDAADREVLDRLVADADVYIQNFRPGVADKLGVGEARLRALNPRLVYCSISGFGATGPAAARPAYDTVAQAASGSAQMQRAALDPRLFADFAAHAADHVFVRLKLAPQAIVLAEVRVVGPAIADALTGFYAAYGILGALVERGRTGEGRTVEVSMLEAMAHFNLDAFTHFLQEGEVMGPYSRPRVSQSYVLECSDGKWIALHMSSPPKFWDGLAKAIEQPDLFDDPRFATREARIDHQEALIALLGERFRKRPRDEWTTRLQALDVPNAPMYDTSEALVDPQALHLQLQTSAMHPTMGLFRTVRSPVSFDGERALAVRPPPVLGEHNEEIRSELAARRRARGA